MPTTFTNRISVLCIWGREGGHLGPVLYKTKLYRNDYMNVLVHCTVPMDDDCWIAVNDDSQCLAVNGDQLPVGAKVDDSLPMTSRWKIASDSNCWMIVTSQCMSVTGGWYLASDFDWWMTVSAVTSDGYSVSVCDWWMNLVPVCEWWMIFSVCLWVVDDI